MDGFPEWIRYLQVEHTVENHADYFDLREVCTDYIDPVVSHCLDVMTPDQELLAFYEGQDWPVNPVDPGEKVARLLVNELPVHMQAFSGNSWFWFCDQCNSGPTANLGGTIDALLKGGLLDFGDTSSGAVLHLQNLEVALAWRRNGIGSRLVRFAMGLLSRSDWDIAVAELVPVRPVYPPLFPDTTTSFPQIIWETEEIISDFLIGLSFRQARESLTLPEWQLRELGMASPETATFYRKITGRDRQTLLRDN